METITIPKHIIKNDDLVLMPRREYEKMKAQMTPTVFLKGKAAKRLDRRVEQGLRDYREGKTRMICSLADLD